MRTKTLLAAASILAAGALSSMAQTSNVYSLNIVGYANVTIGPGNGFYANPLDVDGVNLASTVLTLSPLNDTYAQPPNTMNSFYLLTWNGSGFNQAYFESDYTTGNTSGAVTNGWATDNTASHQGIIPNLPVGKGFIVNNLGNVGTNTFVGNVVPNPGTFFTNHVGSGNELIGGTLPVGFVAPTNTGIVNINGNSPLPNPLSPLNDTYAQPAGTWNSFYVLKFTGAGFQQSYFESDFTANNTGGAVTNGWATDNTASKQALPPSIAIGEGYFVNNLGTTTDWISFLTNSP